MTSTRPIDVLLALHGLTGGNLDPPIEESKIGNKEILEKLNLHGFIEKITKNEITHWKLNKKGIAHIKRFKLKK